MNCAAVRDRMPELALGSLPLRDAELFDRHLAWCAACRKEAGDLRRAAAVLPYALAPTTPPEDLEDRVVTAVHEAAGGRRTPARRGRSAAAAAVAAMVAVGALGWGAVMAGRADRFRDQARAAIQRQQAAIQQFSDFLLSPPFRDPENDVYLGTLAGPPGSSAKGSAIALTSPSGKDIAIVSVSGLPTEASSGLRLPYKVTLKSSDGARALVGKITELDTGGEAQVGKDFERDLSGLSQVVVRDAGGAVLLFGTLTLRAAVPSPSP